MESDFKKAAGKPWENHREMVISPTEMGIFYGI
jgi:hypothetical protein